MGDLHVKISFIALGIFPFMFLLSAKAQSNTASTVIAPPLRRAQTIEKDWGLWDDAFACSQQSIVILRREDELYSLSPDLSAEPKKLLTAPLLSKTQIVTCAEEGNRLWLFMKSKQISPFAIDAYSGEILRFDIPGLKVPGDRTAEIQSYVIIPHAGAILLEVSGGDSETWPWDVNGPLYFWMSLKSGKLVAFPIGWDLNYFSFNQKIAVFHVEQQKDSERQPLQAVDMQTGDFLTKIPNRLNSKFVPFDWTNTQVPKPLYVRRQGKGDQDYFAGITVRGTVFPFDLGLNGIYYLSNVQTNDGFAGFRLRLEGTSAQPDVLWHMRLSQGQRPQPLVNGVTDFVMLGKGSLVYSTTGRGSKSLFAETFFHGHNGKIIWNVLDRVEHLPEWDKDFVNKDYVDENRVSITGGFGGKEHDRLALCLFTHIRRNVGTSFDSGLLKPVQSKTWQRAVIVTSDGQRYMTDLFREGRIPDQVWLFNQGSIISAEYLWDLSKPGSERKVHLFKNSFRIN